MTTEGTNRLTGHWARPAAVGMLAAITISFAGVLWLSLTMPREVPADDFNLASSLAPTAPAVLSTAIAALLMVRRPANPLGWMVGGMMLWLGLSGFATLLLDHQLYRPDFPTGLVTWIAVVSSPLTGIVTVLMILMALLFPDGQLLSKRWRLVVWLAVASFVTGGVTVIDPEGLGDGHRFLKNPVGLPGAHGVSAGFSTMGLLIWAALMVIAIASLAVRYRRVGADQRHQIKWFATGITILVLGIVAASLTSTNSNWTTPLPISFEIIAFSALPVSIAVALLKYRLYDIDVVINRAILVAAMAAFITLIYLALVVGIGSLVGGSSRGNLILSIAATALVALAFHPARVRAQRVANRIAYGERATPYEVLSDFSQQMAEAFAGGDLLPRMARLVGEGTGARRADVWARSGAELRPVASWPSDPPSPPPIAVVGQIMPPVPAADHAVPVRHQGELMGALTLSKKVGDALSPMEARMVSDLASQAGLVLKNFGLTADLQARLDELRASRQRLVTAQDDERRKLERNLHDGAQQQLVALKVKLGIARTLARRQPDKADAMLAELAEDADAAVSNLRDLARGIYPPLLAEQGLQAALEAQARKAILPVRIDVDGTGRYAQDIEAAVYFCCLEGLQNVQKYAGASEASVRVRRDGDWLEFEVTDNGAGFNANTALRGAGLTNMTDRLEALGGDLSVNSSPGQGTRIVGRLPMAPNPARGGGTNG